MKEVTRERMDAFCEYLINEEKSTATVSKYLHDVAVFAEWLGTRDLEKIAVVEYKTALCEKYAPASVNATLSSLNCFFAFCGWYDLRVKNLKIQRQIFASTEKELTKAEYDRLLQAAKQKESANRTLFL